MATATPLLLQAFTRASSSNVNHVQKAAFEVAKEKMKTLSAELETLAIHVPGKAGESLKQASHSLQLDIETLEEFHE